MINKLLNSKEVKSDIINMDSSSLFYLLDEIKLEGRKKKVKRQMP